MAGFRPNVNLFFVFCFFSFFLSFFLFVFSEKPFWDENKVCMYVIWFLRRRVFSLEMFHSRSFRRTFKGIVAYFGRIEAEARRTRSASRAREEEREIILSRFSRRARLCSPQYAKKLRLL